MPFAHRVEATGTTGASQTVNIPLAEGGGVMWFLVYQRGTATVPLPTVTSPAATFTVARSQLAPDNTRRVTAWWSNDYEAQTNMPVTINTGVTATTLMWAAEEQFGADLAGSAVVQANGAGLTGTLTTLSTTLTAGTGEMLVYSGFLGGSGHNCTPGGNGTELFEISSGSSSKHHAYWEAVTPTNPQITITGGTTAQAAIIAVETAVTADRMVHRAGGGDDTDATSYTKTIPLIQGGGVLWVTAFSARTPSVTTPPVVPTLTLAGATFTLAHTVALPDAPPGDRLSVLYSQDYDAATGASLQFGFGAETQGYLTWSVDEDLGGAASGTPYAQVNASWTAGTTHSAALSAGTGNTFMVASARNDSVPGTYAPVGGVELVDTTSSATLKSLGAFWWPTVKTSPTVTTGTLTTQLIAFELKAAVVAVAEAEVGWAKLEVPDAVTQAELSFASLEVPDVPLPPEGQVGYARMEVPDAPTPADPWDPAAECETLEYRNPAGETVRFRTLIGTVGRFMPPISVTTIRTPAGHGSHYLGSAHLERPVAVPVAIPGPLDGRADLRSWARILDPSVGEGTLTVVEGTWAGRRLRCVYEAGLDEWAEINRRVNQGTLLFRAAWPYWEDSSEFTVGVDQDDNTHTWFPFLPLVFGASDAFALLTADNTGDVDAWPVITVQGPAEHVTVTNLTTGAFWTVTGTLLAGSALEVDHRPGYKTVRVDGVNVFDQLTATSSLWPLVRGVNQIEVGALTTDPDTLITFTWRRNWLAA